MIVFPNAKINLGLHVLRKRADNFHDLETIFYPIPLNDIIEIVPDQITGSEVDNHGNPGSYIILNNGSRIRFSASGELVADNPENNLCIQACKLFDEQVKKIGNIRLHLHKNIPMGAGLGGGSSDAVFTLKALNELNGNPASAGQLKEMAMQLGSDCAFFLYNKPAGGSGRGDILTPCNLSLKDYFLVVVKPDVHVATSDAFRGIKPRDVTVSLAEIIKMPIELWRENLRNDFETTILSKYPVIENMKNQLLKNGAIYTSLTGSGSAVYGIFKSEVDLTKSFKGSFYFSCFPD